MVMGGPKEDRGGSVVAPTNNSDHVMDSNAITPKPTPTKTHTVSSHPRRVQPALPTGTQGEKMIKHGTGVPPPLVGRLGANGELGSHDKACDRQSTTQPKMM